MHCAFLEVFGLETSIGAVSHGQEVYRSQDHRPLMPATFVAILLEAGTTVVRELSVTLLRRICRFSCCFSFGTACIFLFGDNIWVASIDGKGPKG